jgi:serine protease
MLVVASLLGGVLSHAQAQPQAQVASGFIVQLKQIPSEGSLVTPAQVQARFQRLGRLAQASGYTAQMPWRHLSEHMVSMRVPTRLSPAMQQKLVDRLMASGQVAWVEPNVKQQLAQSVSSPDDSYYVGGLSADDAQSQWWLKNPMGAERAGVPGFAKAWERSTGTNSAPGVVVAVLDTGYLPHADLPTTVPPAGQPTPVGTDARVLPGRDFVSDVDLSGDGDGWDTDPTDAGDYVTATEAASPRFKELRCMEQDSTWHGQVISGILGASSHNNTDVPGGVAGINWGVRLLPVRVAGKCGANLDDIVAGMYWAAGMTIPSGLMGTQPVQINPNPAKIINISFGGSGSCGNLYSTAIAALKAQQVVVVAAAGNEHGAVSRPGNCADVLTVAALNRAGFKSSYSNFGPEVFISTVGGDPGPFSGFSDGGSWGADLGDTGMLTVSNGGDQQAAAGSTYSFHAGTSYAAPILAGVVSLMLDVDPTLSIDDIKRGLRASARPHVLSTEMGACSSQNPGRCICTTSACGVGILDAAEALAFAANPAGYQPPVRPSAITVNEEPIRSAKASASQDRPANVPQATSVGGSGGGGVLDVATLFGLAGLLLLAGVSSRRQ